MTKLEKIKDFCFTPKDMQLKAIKHYPSMSQETYCYEANLYILDVKICRVHNVGRGGSDDFDLEDPNLLGAGFLTWEYIQQLDEWCKRNLPKWYFEYRKEYVPTSLEAWLGEQVTEYVNWKEFNKAYKKSILFVRPDDKELCEFIAKPTKEHIDVLTKRHPKYTFLHNIEKDTAYKLFIERT